MILPASEEEEDGPSGLTAETVYEVKALLAAAGNLPPELVDIIIDHAEYWPSTRTVVDTPCTASAHSAQVASILYLRTPPVPGAFADPDDPDSPTVLGGEPAVRGVHPVRKVVFRLTSRDQGWSGTPQDHMTFRGAYSWWEVAAESPLSAHAAAQAGELLAPQAHVEGAPESGWRRWDGAWVVQRNRHAQKQVEEREVVWRATDEDTDEYGDWQTDDEGKGRRGGSLVRALSVGDRLLLVAKAQYPMWQNQVRKAEVEVYYAV
ncbi:hypothetical protein BV25DRAFT_1820549 [Artomyces pyxidatus]|uniref:Uncharacterized protein n=1 Tax=Artomyces pyxidatus TaxID=48021 RepID=A0ACB8TDQ4_9AGAM|nr:hypothetical protein BV25DRAFT_1820549 [Artomyces pyxidatus]